MFILLFISLCMLIYNSECVVPYNDVKSDYETLLSAYRMTDSLEIADVIPKDLAPGPIDVYMGIALYAIIDYDGVSGRIQLVASMRMEWLDEAMDISGTTFTESLQTLFVGFDQIWTPNLVLMSAVDSVKRIGDESYKVRYNVSSGYCKWYPRMIINAACTPDMTYYPFDKQTCVLTITPWNRDENEVKLLPLTNEWNTNNLEESGIWDISETSSEAYLVSFIKNTTNSTRYHIDFNITIKRKPLFLALVIVLPVLLLSLLTGFIFLLPPGSGERVGFGITSFLSFIVLLQTLMSFMPEVSSPMSILCFYVTIMLSFSVLLSIANAFLLRMYLSPSKDDVPGLFVFVLEFITCKIWQRCPKCPEIKWPKFKRKIRHDTVHNTRFSRRVAMMKEIPESKETSFTENDSGFYIGDGEDDDEVDDGENSPSTSGYQSSGRSNFHLVRSMSFPDKRMFLETDKANESGTKKADENVRLGSVPTLCSQEANRPKTTGYRSDSRRNFQLAGSVSFPEKMMFLETDKAMESCSEEANENARLGSVPTLCSQDANRPNTSGYRSGSRSNFQLTGSMSFPEKMMFLETDQANESCSKEENETDRIGSACSQEATKTVRLRSAVSEREETPQQEIKMKLTWEYLAQMLDLFFIVVFLVVQTVFTMFYLVPLGAQY